MTSSVKVLAAAAAILLSLESSARLGAQGQVPSVAQGVANQPDEVEGELQVQVEDWNSGSRVRHYVRMSNGQKVELLIAGAAPDLPTGTRVRARGRLDRDTLALDSRAAVEALAAPAVANTFGNQKTLVILVNFRNDASQPYTPADAQGVTFSQTSGFYLENSYQQTWLSGAVAGWFTIAIDNGNCDYDQIAMLGEQAAAAAGVNLAAYPHRVFGFPSNSGCGWWGLGYVGGNPSRAWINGAFTLKVVAHEFGHNLGDYHSKAILCDVGGCSTSEYGDTHDVMGNPSSGHLTAFQKERLGWLGYGASPPIQTVTASGDYWIDSMSNPGTAPKALKIFKGPDGSGRNVYHYLEARTVTGFDGAISPGVLVHTAVDGDADTSYMIDLAPTSGAFDDVLDVSQVYDDATSGLSVTTLWNDATGAMVRVSLTGQACTMAAPTVSASPSATVITTPGSTINYSMTVRNQDSAGCAASRFDLEAVAPAGWTSAIAGTPALTLAPGQSGAASFSVVTSAAASGAYSIVADASRSGPGGMVMRNVMVVSGLNVSVSVSSVRGQYTIATSVTANGAPVSGAAVTVTITSPTGGSKVLSATTTAGGSASVKFKPGPRDPAGTYRVAVTATSGNIAGSASGSFTVQ